MKYSKLLAAVAVGSFVMAGCASVAHIEKDDSVNFSSYRTFAWVETKAENNDSTKTPVSDLTEQSLTKAVSAELIKAGWKESKRPDVLLTYDVLVEKAVKQTADPVYSQSATRYYYNPYSRRWMSVYYPSQFVGYDRNQQQVREGTVTVSMIDAKTDKTVWQGWTTDEVNSKNLTAKEIQSSVKNIFKKFDLVKN